ncbi:hypothetical protein EsH8_VIII_000975 [Colletotrichum jinshuiense]
MQLANSLFDQIKSAAGESKTATKIIFCDADNLDIDSIYHGKLACRDNVFKLTRRTDWAITWGAKRSSVEVQEGNNGEIWTEQVGELPANVQANIAAGDLEAWVKNDAKAASSGSA